MGTDAGEPRIFNPARLLQQTLFTGRSQFSKRQQQHHEQQQQQQHSKNRSSNKRAAAMAWLAGTTSAQRKEDRDIVCNWQHVSASFKVL
ncbi:hypothetical protein ACSSS7_000505 [Eimeria intestinalis]